MTTTMEDLMLDELLAVERKLWTNDAAYYEQALIPEALLVFAETGVLTRDQAVAAIREENATGRRWGDVRFSDQRTLSLGDDAAVLIYRAEAQWEGERDWHRALCSSTYVRRDGAWHLAHHQQSAVED